jgi:hypothetical protein
MTFIPSLTEILPVVVHVVITADSLATLTRVKRIFHDICLTGQFAMRFS